MKIDAWDFRLTPLQETVLRLTNQFDMFPEVRHEILVYGLPATTWHCLQEAETEYPLLFKFLSSPIWLREAVRGYLLYLEQAIDRIRGQEPERFILPKDFPSIVRAENIRSRWLELDQLREAVSGLQTALGQTFDWFNLQIVCGLVRQACERTAHREEKPSFCKNIQPKEADAELRALENFAYVRGRSCFTGVCRTAHAQLVNVPNVEPALIQVFNVTSQQLWMIASVNRGNIHIGAQEITAHDVQDKPKAPSRWITNPSGLIVPDSF